MKLGVRVFSATRARDRALLGDVIRVDGAVRGHRQRIRLPEILEVFPSRNPLSSPALSLDRLEIKFGQGYLESAMISPVPREEFLGELARRANLQRDGARLVR